MSIKRTTEVVDEPVRDSEAHEHAGAEEVVTTRPDGATVMQGIIRMLSALVALAVVTLEALLAFRFAFLLGGANPDNGFVDFIYDSTSWIVDPFEGIANTSTVDDGIFDPATLIAMAVVAVVGLLIIMGLWALSMAPSMGHTTSTSRSTHGSRTIHEE
jgi:hypothetical protein